MRTFTRSVLATVAAVPLCLVAAAPAYAAPADVSFEATTAGDTVTGTFSNESDTPIACIFIGLREPFDPAVPEYSDEDVVLFGFVEVKAGETGSSTSENLTVGEELFVEWNCYSTADVEDPELWGSWPAEEGNDFVPTGEPQAITVGGTGTEETCFGSVCLPTGSFGF